MKSNPFLTGSTNALKEFQKNLQEKNSGLFLDFS